MIDQIAVPPQLEYHIYLEASRQHCADIFDWCQTVVGHKQQNGMLLWNVSWRANLRSLPEPRMWCWSFLYHDHAVMFLLTWGGELQ